MTDVLPENDGQEFEEISEEELALIVRSAERSEQAHEADLNGEEVEQPGSMTPDDMEEQGARGLVAFMMGVFNFLLKFKDPRVQYSDEMIAQAQDEMSPVFMKYGLGSSAMGRCVPEMQAGSFMFHLGMGTVQAIKENRRQDEAEARKKERGAVDGD